MQLPKNSIENNFTIAVESLMDSLHKYETHIKYRYSQRGLSRMPQITSCTSQPSKDEYHQINHQEII